MPESILFMFVMQRRQLLMQNKLSPTTKFGGPWLDKFKQCRPTLIQTRVVIWRWRIGLQMNACWSGCAFSFTGGLWFLKFLVRSTSYLCVRRRLWREQRFW